jgi:hypothetical protein
MCPQSEFYNLYAIIAIQPVISLTLIPDGHHRKEEKHRPFYDIRPQTHRATGFSGSQYLDVITFLIRSQRSFEYSLFYYFWFINLVGDNIL